ncbi:hypothetical protein B0920_23310 [Massilia sp. KIM]|uniref:MORN repeat-containing protein n=1 Tax=Massilia sp. KIM TaxID=1955422 RepID=UPI0009C7FDC2|nr:hypothetical protein [Massilia sp. KIM]OON59325.1 hypothetical protein B0920_23310 [Massilia sp. KIM]
MPRFSVCLVSTLGLLTAMQTAVQAADISSYLGPADCRIAPVRPAPADGKLAWSGACKEGYAEGKGTLAWQAGPELGLLKLEATLARGLIIGEATLTGKRGLYIGSVDRGLPHGAGYFRSSDGVQYEGGVVDGNREGKGVLVEPDGSRYEGEFKGGKRSGAGKASFALGGSYEGEWRDDAFHGKGRIVYAGQGHVHEGEFVDGRPAGATPLASESRRFGLKFERSSSASQLLDDMTISALPPGARWRDLTPGQQDLVRSAYPALEPGDEPPYPLNGLRVFYQALSKVAELFSDYKGEVQLLISVDAQGVPTKVQTVGVTNADLNRALSVVAISLRFKPALCRGLPCAMIYPSKIAMNAE